MAVKPIVHDELSLKFKSLPATKQDLGAATDLKDTLLANKDRAAGLAANMIGVQKRIIGERPTKRYKNITVKYQNENLETRQQSFSDFTAEVIQHEVDHCNGILI